MKKFTAKEIKKKLARRKKKYLKRSLPLVIGMIDIHGYDKDQAFAKSLKITRSWREGQKGQVFCYTNLNAPLTEHYF